MKRESKNPQAVMNTHVKKGFVILISIVCLILSLSGCKSDDYKKANAFLEEKHYEDALNVYAELGDYKDTPSKILECKYEIALLKIADSDFDGAVQILEELGEYKDSTEKKNECLYEMASQKYADQDFSGALEELHKLGDYKNAQEMASTCEREIGMREKSDYAFLDAISESILTRLESSRTGTVDHSTLVSTELAYLEKFKDADFYDAELKSLATKYINGLYIQKESLTQEVKSDEQIKWQEGMVDRFDVLKELYEKYGLLSDNQSFIGAYIAEAENQHRILDGIYAIEKDLDEQLNGENQNAIIRRTSYQILTFSLQNNTEYTFDLNFVFMPKDKDGVIIDSRTYYVPNIKPGAKYTVSCYKSQPNQTVAFEFETFYSNIK